MDILFSLLIIFSITYLISFIGHLILKKIKLFKNENEIILKLIEIAIGYSFFLMTVNLICNFTKDFYRGLITTIIIILMIIFKERNCYFQYSLDFFQKIKNSTKNIYFWLLCIFINLLYGLTTLSSTKIDHTGLGNSHIFNINQLLIGNYPLKYSFSAILPQKYHYGSDILGAVVCKFSGCQPEISLDILIIFFLNLTLLTIYSLAKQFVNSNKINKYIITYTAFLGWRFTIWDFKDIKNVKSVVDLFKLLKDRHSNLYEFADRSGLVIHHFFSPPSGISIFFFLIAVYLIFSILQNNKNLKSIFLIGLFLSSFVILDFTSYIILIAGIITYALLFYTKGLTSIDIVDLAKKLAVLLSVAILVGLIHGNCLAFNTNHMSFTEFFHQYYKDSKYFSNLNPVRFNLILLSLYTFGFYIAYKQNIQWMLLLCPFFISSVILTSFLTAPDYIYGRILFTSNILGAFSLPYAVYGIKKILKIENKFLSIITWIIILCSISFNTILFWAFIDKPSLFTIKNNLIKFSGFQDINSFVQSDESSIIKYLKSKKIKNQGFISDSNFVETISTNTGLTNLSPDNVDKYPLQPKFKKHYSSNYFNSYFISSASLNDKVCKNENIHWLYITQRLIRYMMPPQGRRSFLNSFLLKKANLALSNDKSSDRINLKELYNIDPDSISKIPNDNLEDLLSKFINVQKDLLKTSYIGQIALCNYFGIYNLRSNDFDGDKIADIAFFDPKEKDWYIIHGNNQKETKINLTKFFFSRENPDEQLIPVPSDYDGDLKTDIALFNKTSGDWYIINSSNFKVAPLKKFGTLLGEIPIPGDIDGDGRSETSVYTPRNTAGWPSLLTSNSKFVKMTFPSSSLVDIPAYSDIDGDNKSDYIIYRPTESSFYVYLSSKIYNGIEIKIGNINSRIVLDDYDGDKKVDLAAWSPENGEWEIVYAKDLLTDQTMVNHTKIHLGAAGDTPFPGDYDGDGKSDIAVYKYKSSELEIILPEGKTKKIDLHKYKKFIPACFIGV